MSTFDVDIQMRRWLKRRIEQLTGFFDVKCEVLEAMGDEMGLDTRGSVEGVHEYYQVVSVMTDTEFKRRILEAVKKIEEIKKKKVVAGVS